MITMDIASPWQASSRVGVATAALWESTVVERRKDAMMKGRSNNHL
jgi:hypothetical protein